MCTTYGDAALRARIVLRMARADSAGPSTVAPGETAPLSGKDVWWAGIEGAAYDALPPLPEPAADSPGVRLLLDRRRGSRTCSRSGR